MICCKIFHPAARGEGMDFGTIEKATRLATKGLNPTTHFAEIYFFGTALHFRNLTSRNNLQYLIFHSVLNENANFFNGLNSV